MNNKEELLIIFMVFIFVLCLFGGVTLLTYLKINHELEMCKLNQAECLRIDRTK